VKVDRREDEDYRREILRGGEGRQIERLRKKAEFLRGG